MFNTEYFLNYTGLFWQYPAITEKKFYEQNKHDEAYVGIPWATIIDKCVQLQKIYNTIKSSLPAKNYYTCCQHIKFKQLLPLFKALNITKVYVSHKEKGIDMIQDIRLLPCPIYALNIEDNKFNKEIKEAKDVLTHDRDILFSFVGGYHPTIYMSDIRKKIYALEKRDGVVIENTGDWHLNKLVYHPSQNNKQTLNLNDQHMSQTCDYNKLLLKSRYTLAPSGSGPNSIRFWEALGAGSIPVLLADTLELPAHELWDKTIVRIAEKDVYRVYEILGEISEEEENRRRENCLRVYTFFKDNYKGLKREIIHYCCGSYFKGNYGGVPRYDYQISLAFPEYKHFTGPGQKKELLEYLKRCRHPLVITDNHLSCDIPNTYEILLVHHGCAMTTATNNPDWGEPWKSLCTNGQNKMLSYREVDKTTIISISQSCTDDFTKYYGETYTRFNRLPMLHPSELDENRVKKSWNTEPVVLGNWLGIKKGERLIPELKKNISEFTFIQLNVRGDHRGIDNFNKRKQDIYLNSDIFLQISNSEGNSYATLDALLCGIPFVSSNVGLFYKDMPEDCFVKIDWERNNDVDYVEERLKYAWENKEEIGRKGREWYMKHCRLTDWLDRMRKLVSNPHRLHAL